MLEPRRHYGSFLLDNGHRQHHEIHVRTFSYRLQREDTTKEYYAKANPVLPYRHIDLNTPIETT
jgi:hypothetical protein